MGIHSRKININKHVLGIWYINIYHRILCSNPNEMALFLGWKKWSRLPRRCHGSTAKSESLGGKLRRWPQMFRMPLQRSRCFRSPYDWWGSKRWATGPWWIFMTIPDCEMILLFQILSERPGCVWWTLNGHLSGQVPGDHAILGRCAGLGDGKMLDPNGHDGQFGLHDVPCDFREGKVQGGRPLDRDHVVPRSKWLIILILSILRYIEFPGYSGILCHKDGRLTKHHHLFSLSLHHSPFIYDHAFNPSKLSKTTSKEMPFFTADNMASK